MPLSVRDKRFGGSAHYAETAIDIRQITQSTAGVFYERPRASVRSSGVVCATSSCDSPAWRFGRPAPCCARSARRACLANTPVPERVGHTWNRGPPNPAQPSETRVHFDATYAKPRTLDTRQEHRLTAASGAMRDLDAELTKSSERPAVVSPRGSTLRLATYWPGFVRPFA